MSYPAMSLGDRFCVSGKGRCVGPKSVNSMAVSGFAHEKPLVGAGYTISLDFKHKWT